MAGRPLDLFEPPRLAQRPYATDSLDDGIWRQAPARALGRRYIETNCEAFIWRLVFDLDRPGAVLAAQDADLAAPSWVATNPRNGHAHLAYELRVPVVKTDAARRHPMRYLAALEDAYMRRLAADVGYSGLICKNPRHTHWLVEQQRLAPYDLGELAEYVDLAPYLRAKNPRPAQGPAGRNNALFDALRCWAYTEIRAAKAAGSFDAWQHAVHRQAEAGNAGFHGLGLTRTDPLGTREVAAIAKSVATWTWRRFDLASSDARFSALQAARGRLGGYAKAAAHGHESTEAAAPWVVEGISRATWYRRRRAAEAA